MEDKSLVSSSDVKLFSFTYLLSFIFITLVKFKRIDMSTGMFRPSLQEIILPSTISMQRHMRDGKTSILIKEIQLVKQPNSKYIYKKSSSKELTLLQIKDQTQCVIETTLKRLLRLHSLLIILKLLAGSRKEVLILDQKNGQSVNKFKLK